MLSEEAESQDKPTWRFLAKTARKNKLAPLVGWGRGKTKKGTLEGQPSPKPVIEEAPSPKADGYVGSLSHLFFCKTGVAQCNSILKPPAKRKREVQFNWGFQGQRTQQQGQASVVWTNRLLPLDAHPSLKVASQPWSFHPTRQEMLCEEPTQRCQKQAQQAAACCQVTRDFWLSSLPPLLRLPTLL